MKKETTTQTEATTKKLVYAIAEVEIEVDLAANNMKTTIVEWLWVGQTADITRRFAQHKARFKKLGHHGFLRCWVVDPNEDPNFDCSVDEFEQELLLKIKPKYNKAKGGPSATGFKRKKSSNKKISTTKKMLNSGKSAVKVSFTGGKTLLFSSLTKAAKALRKSPAAISKAIINSSKIYATVPFAKKSSKIRCVITLAPSFEGF